MDERPDHNNRIAPESVERGEFDRVGMISPSQLARFWGVHINSVYRAVQKGALRAYRLPGGTLRIRTKDAQRFGRPVE